MKRKNGKWMKLAVALMLCLCVLPAAAFAAEEVEDNGSFSKAQVLEPGELAQGSNSSCGDADFYKVVLEEPGYVNLVFNHEYIDENYKWWAVYFYDGNQKLIFSDEITGHDTQKEYFSVGLPAGACYVRVTKATTVPYEVGFKVTPAADWETEFNEDFKTADPVPLNRKVNGSIHSTNDVDFFKLEVTEPGYMNLEFVNEYFDYSLDCFYITLYNEEHEQMAYYEKNASKTRLEGRNIGVAPGTYYVKVHGTTYSIGYSYDMKLNFTSADDWESELNNDAKHADPLTLGKPVNGSVMFRGQSDYYTFTLEQSEVLSLTLNHPVIDSYNSLWTVQVLDENQQEVVRQTYWGNDKGDTMRPLNLAAGTYYVRVYEGYSHNNEEYKLTVAVKPDVNFRDVTRNDYFHDPVQWAVKMNITKGIGSMKFGPEFTCTRGQAVTFLWHAAGDPEPQGRNQFKDVKSSDYFCKPAMWAAEKGITKGIGGGLFGSEYECTRGQIVTFLWKALGDPEATEYTDFSDVKDSDYFSNAVQWAVQNNITKGIGGGMFGPEYPCTRGQIVTFLHHAYAK